MMQATTITLCANLVGAALDRAPYLDAEQRFCALVYGVHLLLSAGAYGHDGKLYLPRETV